MEQNLSEKERKKRLTAGILFEALAGINVFIDNPSLALIFAVGGIAFIANYFTCFCGTKKLINKLKEKL